MSDSAPIVVQQRLSASREVAWQAITDKDQMPKWFFEQIADFQPEVGFGTQFTVHVEGTDFIHVWNITEVVPQERISYGWRYDGVPGDSTVTWELSDAEDGTLVTLTHAGGESFPQDEGVFSREACQGGWEYFLGRLAEFVKTK